MKNQRDIWNKAHSSGRVIDKNSSFASEVIEIIPPSSKILELGCGAGIDAAFFAENGHQVIATDFSESAIESNKEKYHLPNLEFKAQDISNPFKFQNNNFDLIYARLSLHYFIDAKTREIFHEIKRVLKPGGTLAFICKSTKDPIFGKGKEIEKDMFESDHIRHFFSEEYVKELLGDSFEIKKLEEGRENFYNKPSAFIKVIALKK